MQTSFDKMDITFLVGDPEAVVKAKDGIPTAPFDEKRIDFLDNVSRHIMKDSRSRDYSDVITFAFWIRKANMTLEKERLGREELLDSNVLSLGRGVAFHIAPSNVAVNFAYSLVVGFITGNNNIVRVPRKPFEQVDIISDAFSTALEEQPEFFGSIVLVRYGRDKIINDFFSSICDIRVIWGGDDTIAELRRSPISSRTVEITFADRYSFAIIDADYYLTRCEENESYSSKAAKEFYNDTYLTDQQACTAPRLVCWIGNDDTIEEASRIFWSSLKQEVNKYYKFRDIQGVDKLTTLFLAAAEIEELRAAKCEDGSMYRVILDSLDRRIMDYRGNSGFFYEYHLKKASELDVISDKRVQTVSYIGEKEQIREIVSNVRTKGIDRIVPVGHSMDFGFIWDGYDLTDQMTRRMVLI